MCAASGWGGKADTLVGEAWTVTPEGQPLSAGTNRRAKMDFGSHNLQGWSGQGLRRSDFLLKEKTGGIPQAEVKQAPTRLPPGLRGEARCWGPSWGFLYGTHSRLGRGQTQLGEPAANHCRQRVTQGELSVTAGVSCGPARRWRRVTEYSSPYS